MTVDYSSETMETRRKQKIFLKYGILKGVLLFVSCERPYAENDYRLGKKKNNLANQASVIFFLGI